MENQASILQSIEKRNLMSRIRAEILSKNCLRILHNHIHTLCLTALGYRSQNI